MDTSRAPDLANFGARVKQTLEEWYPSLASYLTSPGFVDVQSIPIYFNPDYDGVAYTVGNRIVGAVDYYRSHQDDVGSMIHEMVHVIQGYRNGPGWLVEGIADYVRYYIYEPNRQPGKPGPGNNYTDGYGVTAYFLNYIVTRVRSDMIYWSNKDMREGTYADSIWPRLTGKDLPTMWADMLREGWIYLSLQKRLKFQQC